MTQQQRASSRITLKLAVIAFALAAVGLPVNTLASFAALALVALIALTGLIATSPTRWLGAAALAIAVLIVHIALPAPRIEEGHNAFLIDKANGALERGLPREAFAIMAKQFTVAYPHKQCREGAFACWGFTGLKDSTFAFAADGVFDRGTGSRRVTRIDFDSATWLRLGFVNDLAVNFVGQPDGLERMRRDRRSLAIFGRWQLKLPWFVMYRFPADFVGSRLCWRGEVLWEGTNEQFERFDSADFACRILQPADIGRRIFGVSIGRDAELAMSLETKWHVTARRSLAAVTSIIGVAGILWLLIARWRSHATIFPLWLTGLALIVVVAIDATLIGGFRPLDGADDGLVFSGFARIALEALTRGDILGFLRGGEDVYAFTAGMRYFRALEYLVFGDTFLGYLAVMLALPLIVFALARRFIGLNWAVVFVLVFVATPLGALFGTSYFHHIAWASRGFADPLATTFFFASVLVLAGPAMIGFDSRAAPAFWGALLMALAVVVRPNLVLGAAVLLTGVGLMALRQRRLARFALLCIGFAPVFFPLWHNWHFGGVIVLFSDILTNANIYMVPPAAYVSALGELVRLDFAGENIALVVRQLALWLSGPSGLWIMIPLHVAALAVLLRVVFGARFEPMLRLVALATLALAPPAFVYVIVVRYYLALWLLTAIVSAAWLQTEGLALFDDRFPGAREWLARNLVIAWIGRALAQSKARAELDAPRGSSQEAP